MGNRVKGAALALTAGTALLAVGLASCMNSPSNMGYNAPNVAPASTPVATPAGTPSGTPVATPVSVGTGTGNTFSPATLSVASGTTVNFTAALNGHTVHIDDGSGSGTCSSVDLTAFPASHSFVGFSGQVFHIHCDYHSGCGGSSCSGCTGMVMSVTIL